MNYSSFTSLDEVMEVEKIVDLVHANTKKQYRLEVIKHRGLAASGYYDVHYYELSKPGTWVKYLNFPSTTQSETVENALYEAMSYINNRPQEGPGK